jgi:hypothetical protein
MALPYSKRLMMRDPSAAEAVRTLEKRTAAQVCGFYTTELIPERAPAGDQITGRGTLGGVVIIQVRLSGTGYYRRALLPRCW